MLQGRRLQGEAQSTEPRSLKGPVRSWAWPTGEKSWTGGMEEVLPWQCPLKLAFTHLCSDKAAKLLLTSNEHQLFVNSFSFDGILLLCVCVFFFMKMNHTAQLYMCIPSEYSLLALEESSGLEVTV